ncbi:N-acetylglucosamine kinase [Senegalia massiliensis]|uniref:ATPase n=1 Tax=Senegalia massiliensis TaxID=1720316 RepID=A0A845QWQ0_9CLOT|nr:BadF/BadG/BcrA/BcrD ATPase family protein [Senegalia massiliensis]NBI07347.1 ATPase [Senegalia massiliensis]
MNFLGIDGGGSTTEFILIDEKGSVLSHQIKETCHYKNTSFDTFKDVIKNGIEEICTLANINIKNIDYSYLGIPGYGEIASDMPILEEIIKQILNGTDFKIGNDSEVGWAGSLACEPGINIVAGTGAIGFGIDGNGKSARSSGWGHFIGDEGSAYWLAKKLLETFSKQSDGRLERTHLYDILREHFKLEDDFDLIDIMSTAEYVKRNELSKLAKITSIAAEKEDKYAVRIYRDAAYEHFLTINAVIEKLDFDGNEKITVSYSGGVFKAGKHILEPLREYLEGLNRGIKLISPLLSPIKGAALYASKLYFGEVKEEIVENLKENNI